RSRHCGTKQVRLSRVGGLVMQNRPLCFFILMSSAVTLSCRGQDAVTSRTKVEAASNRFSDEATGHDAASPEAQSEPVIVSATRFDIPLDQSPASVSVVTLQDIEVKQIERVSDALRDVPGLAVVQTGTAGQLTS